MSCGNVHIGYNRFFTPEKKLTKKFTLYRAEKKPPVMGKKLILLWLYFQEEFMAFIVTHVTGVTKE